eukprot:5997160-Alexandrium_andersonii.AAC.1
MDSCFLAKDGSDASVTVLAIKGRDSRAGLARPVLRKGRLGEGAMGQAVASICQIGRHLFKTDDETALVDLCQAVADRLGVQTALGSPPAYELQSNGSVEN